MILLIAFILLIIAGFSYLCHRDVVAPSFLCTGTWGLLLFFYAVLDHGLYPLSDKLLMIILIWNIVFCIGAHIFSKINLGSHYSNPGTSSEYINITLYRIYFAFVCLSIPVFAYVCYKRAVTSGGNFFLDMRLAGLMESEYDVGIFKYAVPCAYILLIVELLRDKIHRNKKMIILLFIVNLGMGILSMAKSSLLSLLGGCLITLFLKHRIAIKHIVLGGIVTLFLMSSLQVLRAGDQETDSVLSSMFKVYIFGGLPAMDAIIKADMHSERSGQITAQFLRNVTDRIGITKEQKPLFINDVTDEENYIYTPFPTNVYTVLSAFWLDFSYSGIVCFGFIFGAIVGTIYRIARKNENFGIILYSYVAILVVLQFFAEYIFSNFSYFLQIILLSYLITRRFKPITIPHFQDSSV